MRPDESELIVQRVSEQRSTKRSCSSKRKQFDRTRLKRWALTGRQESREFDDRTDCRYDLADRPRTVALDRRSPDEVVRQSQAKKSKSLNSEVDSRSDELCIEGFCRVEMFPSDCCCTRTTRGKTSQSTMKLRTSTNRREDSLAGRSI